MTDGFKVLRFLCASLCIFSAYSLNASQADDTDDAYWEFRTEDYIDDDEDDEDDVEECRCLWCEEDRIKAAEYDKYVEEIELASMDGNHSSAQSRGLGKWFAKKVKKCS